MRLGLPAAEAIIDGAKSSAREHDLRPLAIVVLDAGGHVIAAQRQDGASIKRYEIAFAKAHGSISLGLDSRDLMARAQQQPYFISSVTSAIGGALIPVPGGVLIHNDDGELVGAVGVSGDTSDNDEEAACAGIRAAGFERCSNEAQG